MLSKKTLSEKVMVLGLDGLDPSLVRKYVNMGELPNFKKYIEKGSARKDLKMLGANPPVTPAQWTTLSTGAFPMTHGITEFYILEEELDQLGYSMDSKNCMAEQIWNCFVEDDKKALVFHWPGCSWPPTSDSPNLHVVDGMSPGAACMATSTVDQQFLVGASENISEVNFLRHAATGIAAPCIGGDVDKVEDETENDTEGQADPVESYVSPIYENYIINSQEGMNYSAEGAPLDTVQSPIKPAKGWINSPEDAKEFTLLLSKGLIRRVGLILKNKETGKYDKIAIYKSKKEETPIFEADTSKMVSNVVDQAIKNDKVYNCIRNFRVIDIAEDGSALKMYVSEAMDIENDRVWYPQSLFNEVTQQVGFPPCNCMLGAQDKVLMEDCMLENWKVNGNWHANALQYLMDKYDYNLVMTHYHAVDLMVHMAVRYVGIQPDAVEKDRGGWINTTLKPEDAQDIMLKIYQHADEFVGRFLKYLDQGWTILIVSDHALVCPAHVPPMFGDMTGINANLMEELGYTVLLKDKNGERRHKCDWSQTKAVACGSCHIRINLKGRDPHGIVEPEDKYELEEQIITDLYGVRDPVTGKRVIALALRNKDAVLLGLGGPRSGDIIVFTAEGYNYDHTDSLTTTEGLYDTSVGPIFIAAGKGIKENFTTERWIREVDVVPTVAVLGGVRMPTHCEGAPVYQIIKDE